MAGINRWDYGIEKKNFLFRIVGLKNPIGDAQMCFVYKVGKTNGDSRSEVNSIKTSLQIYTMENTLSLYLVSLFVSVLIWVLRFLTLGELHRSKLKKLIIIY